MNRRVLFWSTVFLGFLGLCGLTTGRPAAAQTGRQGDRMRELPSPNAGQSPSRDAAPPLRRDAPANMDEIIRKFAAKESEFRDARNNYTFRQEVRIQELDGEGGRSVGEFYRVSEILFTDSGTRTERIVRFPPSTLRRFNITPSDIRDLAGVQPFSLTTEDLSKYVITYYGKEKVDEVNTYVFDVRPKSLPKFKEGSERYFMGRIWVDDQDLQIVKTYGKGVPEDENNRFPRFTTYRENIDGKYWFPTYTYAEDVLEFKNASVWQRMEVRYTKYKQFKTDVKIITDDDDAPKKP